MGEGGWTWRSCLAPFRIDKVGKNYNTSIKFGSVFCTSLRGFSDHEFSQPISSLLVSHSSYPLYAFPHSPSNSHLVSLQVFLFSPHSLLLLVHLTVYACAVPSGHDQTQPGFGPGPEPVVSQPCPPAGPPSRITGSPWTLEGDNG